MKSSLILPGVAALVGALALLPACDRNDRNGDSVMNQRTTDDGTTSGTSASGSTTSTTTTTTTDTTGTTGAAGTAGSTAGTGTSGSAAGMGSSSASKSGTTATKSTTGHTSKKVKKSGAASGKEEGDINGTAGGTGDKHMSRNEETIGAGDDEITVVQTEERMPSSNGNADTMSGATTGASDVDMNEHNPARGLDPLMALEPYSRIPVHIGSVQVTGKDKSVAILESTNRFIDPNALARNESGMIATIPIANLDLDKFGPGDRHAFQAAMMTRLGNLDHRLDHIRATTMSSISAPRVEIRDRIAMLEGRHSALEEQVDYADTVGQDRWDSFKTGFRDQLATFEKDLANLSVTAR